MEYLLLLNSDWWWLAGGQLSMTYAWPKSPFKAMKFPKKLMCDVSVDCAVSSETSSNIFLQSDWILACPTCPHLWHFTKKCPASSCVHAVLGSKLSTPIFYSCMSAGHLRFWIPHGHLEWFILHTCHRESCLPANHHRVVWAGQTLKPEGHLKTAIWKNQFLFNNTVSSSNFKIKKIIPSFEADKEIFIKKIPEENEYAEFFILFYFKQINNILI